LLDFEDILAAIKWRYEVTEEDFGVKPAPPQWGGPDPPFPHLPVLEEPVKMGAAPICGGAGKSAVDDKGAQTQKGVEFFLKREMAHGYEVTEQMRQVVAGTNHFFKVRQVAVHQ